MTTLVNLQPVSYSNLALIFEGNNQVVLPSLKKASYDWSRNPESTYGTAQDPYGQTIGQNQYSNLVFDVAFVDWIVFRRAICNQFGLGITDAALRDPSVKFDMSLSYLVAGAGAVEQDWFYDCTFVKKALAPSVGPAEVIVSIELKPTIINGGETSALYTPGGLGAGLVQF